MLFYKKIFFLFLVFLLGSCAYKQQNNKNNRVFPQSRQISSPFPQVSRNNIYNKKLIYLKMNNHSTINSDLFEDQLMKYLLKRRLFRKIVTRSPSLYINVERDEIKKVNDHYWFDRTDPLNIEQIELYYLRNKSGLVLEANLQGEVPSSNQYSLMNQLSFWIKLIDAKKGKVLFYARSTSNNNLQGLYATVFNKLAAWLK